MTNVCFLEHSGSSPLTVLHNMRVHKCAVWDWVQFPSLESYLEWINVSAFSASVNHESVKASISVRNCNQASLLAGPSRPERQSNNVWVGPAAPNTTEIFKMYPERASGVAPASSRNTHVNTR